MILETDETTLSAGNLRELARTVGLDDIIRPGSGGHGAAFGLDIRGSAELRAQQSAVGSCAQRGDRQRGLDSRVRTDPGLVTDTVAVC